MSLNPTSDRVASLRIARRVLRIGLVLGVLAMTTLFIAGLVTGRATLLVVSSATAASMTAALLAGLFSVRKDLAEAGVR